MLEGGVLTFFKDSKTSAAGGLVRPVPEQGTLSDLFFLVWFGKGWSERWVPKYQGAVY